jgi:hypothetical protein
MRHGGGRIVVYRGFWGILLDGDHLENLGVVKSIILKQIISK